MPIKLSTGQGEDYEYYQTQINFELSQACLEESPYETFALWKRLPEAIFEILYGVSEDKKNDDSFSCDS